MPGPGARVFVDAHFAFEHAGQVLNLVQFQELLCNRTISTVN
jgi:hypothetical protein